MSVLAPDTDLPVLEALADEPSLSQRELARRAGLSLSKAHFVLRRLVEKGLVKVQNAAQSEHKLGYLYLLTPKGIEAKAKLTYAFLQRSAEQYQRMVERVEAALGPALQAGTNGPVRVAIVGGGALAEVVADLVGTRENALLTALAEADVAVLTDPDVNLPEEGGVTVVRLA